MKVLTIFSFIARLLRSYGIWFLVYLELAGSCLCLLLGSLLAGKVTLVASAMELFGRLFLLAWCGVFGRRGIIDALKTLSVLCPTSSFFFSEPYLTGSLCGETILFFLDLLDFCNFRSWLVLPCILLVCLGVSFLISMNSYYLSKKKKKHVRIGMEIFSRCGSIGLMHKLGGFHMYYKIGFEHQSLMHQWRLSPRNPRCKACDLHVGGQRTNP